MAKIYRGGLPLNKEIIKSDGVSFTTNKEIGKYWASSYINGKLFVYDLLPNSKILKTKQFPENIIPKEKPYTHQDKERIVNYALVKGYDGVDLSYFFNEDEIRIFNLDAVKPNDTFQSLGEAKKIGITTKIKEHDMIAECSCGEKFSYQNSKKDILWECPECKGKKRILTS